MRNITSGLWSVWCACLRLCLLACLSAGAAAAERQERAGLLAQAERALSEDKLDDAERAFERAGAMLHAADAEIGLVRTYMQAGDYQHALSFCAHAAGAHPDEAQGAAFYAWLLHIGGQRVAAQRLLGQAQARLPGDRLLATVGRQLAGPIALASGQLSHPPLRFAPYGSSAGLPATARVLGTGVLVDQGKRVLLPLATLARLPASSHAWVRNGMGRLAKARVERRLPDGMAILRLDQALPVAAEMTLPVVAAFPGSVAYSIEYPRSASAMPGWPTLTSGFLGQPLGAGDGRELGIDLPQGPRGGPVFDAAGRFIGIAVAAAHGADRLVPASRLRAFVGDMQGRAVRAPAQTPMSLDQVYQSALRIAVQIIAPR